MNYDSTSPETPGGGLAVAEKPAGQDAAPATIGSSPSVTEALGTALSTPTANEAAQSTDAVATPIRIPVREPNPSPAPSPFKVPFDAGQGMPGAVAAAEKPYTPSPQAVVGATPEMVDQVGRGTSVGTSATGEHTGFFGKIKKLVTGG